MTFFSHAMCVFILQKETPSHPPPPGGQRVSLRPRRLIWCFIRLHSAKSRRDQQLDPILRQSRNLTHKIIDLLGKAIYKKKIKLAHFNPATPVEETWGRKNPTGRVFPRKKEEKKERKERKMSPKLDFPPSQLQIKVFLLSQFGGNRGSRRWTEEGGGEEEGGGATRVREVKKKRRRKWMKSGEMLFAPTCLDLKGGGGKKRRARRQRTRRRAGKQKKDDLKREEHEGGREEVESRFTAGREKKQTQKSFCRRLSRRERHRLSQESVRW